VETALFAMGLSVLADKRALAGGLGVRAILLALSLPLRISVREKQQIGASNLVFLAPEVDLYQQNGVVVFE
jgi:hypothetical protein